MVKCDDLPRVISDSDWSWLIQIAYKFLILQLFVTNYPAMFRVFQNSAMPAMPGDVFCLHSKYHDELFGDLQILHALLQGFSCVKLGKEMTGKRRWKCQCCLFFCQRKRFRRVFFRFHWCLPKGQEKCMKKSIATAISINSQLDDIKPKSFTELFCLPKTTVWRLLLHLHLDVLLEPGGTQIVCIGDMISFDCKA